MGGSTTTKEKRDPWAPTQSGLKSGLKEATALHAKGGFTVNPYGGDWVAPQSQATLDAREGMSSILPGMSDMAGQAANTISGLASNPDVYSNGWDQVKQNTIADIMPAINSSFAGSGMAGSTLHQQNLAKGLGAGLAGVEQGAWERGKQMQMQAAGMLPQMQNLMMNPHNVAAQLGGQEDAYNQRVIDANMQKDIMGQTAEAQGLQNYMALMSGVGGQFANGQSTQTNNPGLGQMLGAGLQVASMF